MPYAAGLATALLLSGCGGSVPSTEPATPPLVAQSDSTTVASSGTPTTSATTAVEDPFLARIPKAARPNTQAGAEAFAKFFIEQVAASGVKADASLIDGLYTESCKTCLNFAATADALEADGQHHASPSLTITSATANTFTEDVKEIAVWVDAKVVHIVNRSGSPVDTTEAGRGAFVLRLAFDWHWQVTRAQVEEAP